MADAPDQNEPRPADPGPDVPYATEADEGLEAPRRAASAEFDVRADVGSDAVLREAMDPANQSLADALRLSFRVLQTVILVLIVLFAFSGLQQVEEDESGVLTRWGRIVEVGGDKALKPGLRYSLLPYPAGEFILFRDRNRSAGIDRAFWPDLKGQTREAALERARVTDLLVPGRDGYVLTRDGDVAHVMLSARYEIDDPVSAVERIRIEDADPLVALALQRATLHVASTRTLQQLIELGDEDKAEIRDLAQASLDRLRSGIRLIDLSLPEKPSAPFAIEASRVRLQESKVAAERTVVRARQRADEILNRAAGKEYRQIIRLIEEYEDALDLGDAALADEILAAVNAMLESAEAAGEVAEIIADARSYESQVEATLGSEARRFASQLNAYRQHPDLVVMQRWQDAYASVLQRPDAEPFFVPAGASMGLSISGQDEIAELRRKMKLDQKERSAQQEALEALGIRGRRILRGSDYDPGQPGRQLRVTETGEVTGRRSNEP